jgi:hypothetical protein
MYQQPGGGPYYSYGTYPPPPPPTPAARQRNVLGLAALLLGTAGAVCAAIPATTIFSWVLLPVALVLGIVGVCRSGKAKGTSIAAIVVAIVGALVGVTVFFVVAMGDALNQAIDSSRSPSPSSSSAGEPDVGTQENPLPLGDTVKSGDWEIELGEPREAWAQIQAENRYNIAPDPGMEYWIVPVTATYLGAGTESAFLDVTVQFVGADDETYPDACGVIPDPLSDVEDVSSGEVARGNVCVEVPQGADGLWRVHSGRAHPIFFDAR